MTRPANRPIPARRARGQSMVEYLVVAAALATALFAPLPGSSPSQSASQLLAAKVHDVYRDLTYYISLP